MGVDVSMMDEASQRRFLTKFLVGDDCWEWRGTKSYAQFRYGGKVHPAHRVSYELFVGPIPAGLQIDHLCRNPRCVNPSHLEAVTSRENTLRGESLAARNARQTHCKRGHEFTPENTYLHPSGRRVCRTCTRNDRRCGATIETRWPKHRSMEPCRNRPARGCDHCRYHLTPDEGGRKL